MTDIQNELLAMLLENENDFGNLTITWNGQNYIVVPNTYNDSSKSDVIGYNENADFRFRIRLNQFSNGIYPDLEQMITYQGDKFLITGVKRTSNGVFWVYVCERPKVG